MPTVYRMKVWAEDSVKAKSKFWCVRAWSSAAVAISAIMGAKELNEGPAGTWVARRRPSLPPALRYFLKKLRRVKKANGQILSVNEVRREWRGRAWGLGTVHAAPCAPLRAEASFRGAQRK